MASLSCPAHLQGLCRKLLGLCVKSRMCLCACMHVKDQTLSQMTASGLTQFLPELCCSLEQGLCSTWSLLH